MAINGGILSEGCRASFERYVSLKSRYLVVVPLIIVAISTEALSLVKKIVAFFFPDDGRRLFFIIFTGSALSAPYEVKAISATRFFNSSISEGPEGADFPWAIFHISETILSINVNCLRLDKILLLLYAI